MKFAVPLFSIGFYICIYFLITLLKPSEDQLKQMHQITAPTLRELVNTKYFRIIRLNMLQDCPLPLSHQICKSHSCALCRCSPSQIPAGWLTNDIIYRHSSVHSWSHERNPTQTWTWHVQQQSNDDGQYFDLQTNTQAFTNYSNTQIWKYIYQLNSHNGNSSQDINLYKMVSGLHASISTHLSAHYSQPLPVGLQWTGRRQQVKFNSSEFRRRVMEHPQRVNNLLFLYQLTAKAVKEVINDMTASNFTIQSGNITEDLKGSQLINNLTVRLGNFNSSSRIDRAIQKLRHKQVRLYQEYIHNISRIMSCVDCQKCRLFGKTQIIGLGTVMKVLLGHSLVFKRNELVALFNLYDKLSESVSYIYQYSVGVELQHMQAPLSQVKFYYFMGGVLVVCVYIFCNIDVQQRVKKQFKHSFPKNNRFKVQ